jgi:hypothetical protein
MKNILAITIILLIPSLIFAQNTISREGNQSSPKAQISDVSWIAGHWQGEAMGGISEEIWSQPAGNSMMGVFRLVKLNKVSFYEIETITEENESLILRLKHFHGDLRGWEEKDETVDFPLVKLEKNKVYFDGMTFEKVNKSTMNVYVLVGKEGDERKEMKFEYRLVQ